MEKGVYEMKRPEKSLLEQVANKNYTQILYSDNLIIISSNHLLFSRTNIIKKISSSSFSPQMFIKHLLCGGPW